MENALQRKINVGKLFAVLFELTQRSFYGKMKKFNSKSVYNKAKKFESLKFSHFSTQPFQIYQEYIDSKLTSLNEKLQFIVKERVDEEEREINIPSPSIVENRRSSKVIPKIYIRSFAEYIASQTTYSNLKQKHEASLLKKIDFFTKLFKKRMKIPTLEYSNNFQTILNGLEDDMYFLTYNYKPFGGYVKGIERLKEIISNVAELESKFAEFLKLKQNRKQQHKKVKNIEIEVETETILSPIEIMLSELSPVENHFNENLNGKNKRKLIEEPVNQQKEQNKRFKNRLTQPGEELLGLTVPVVDLTVNYFDKAL